jgi:hypothetical protein
VNDSVNRPGLVARVNVEKPLPLSANTVSDVIAAGSVTVKFCWPFVGNVKEPAFRVTTLNPRSENPYECDPMVPKAESKMIYVLPPPTDPRSYGRPRLNHPGKVTPATARFTPVPNICPYMLSSDTKGAIAKFTFRFGKFAESANALVEVSTLTTESIRKRFFTVDLFSGYNFRDGNITSIILVPRM